MVRYELDNTVVLGYVPIRRDIFDKNISKTEERRIRKRVDEIISKLDEIKLVDIDSVTEEGILWKNDDVDKVANYFIEQKVDALFFPHCNFGQEEVVARLAKKINKPVLLWGPRDPAPKGTGPRLFDTQCGLFATSRALGRYKIPYTYIENCWLESDLLEKGIDSFIRVAAAVKAYQEMRIGQIGLRPRQFLSVKVNESELLSKCGIEVTPIWTEEVSTAMQKLETGAAPVGGSTGCDLHLGLGIDGGLNIPKKPVPDPRIAEIMEDISSALDCSEVTEEELYKMALFELAILELARVNKLDAVAVDCWAYSAHKMGIRSCFVLADLFDRGLVAACETDIHAAVTARMLQAAARGKRPAFIADLTMRHPENDNAELLWHCGPYAKSLRKKGAKAGIKECMGQYEIEGGDITVTRFDQNDGEYVLFADEGKGVEGPVTNGNYVWFETNDWPTWEKKFINGPYIHHVSSIHGKYAGIMKEACKYINISFDSVNRIEYK